MAYRIVISPAAQRQLDRLRGAAFAGAAKLAGRHNLWRLRMRIDGRAWRVVYEVDESMLTVTVTRVVPRDEGTYRGL